MKKRIHRKEVPMAGNGQRTTARKAPRRTPRHNCFQFQGTLYIAGRRFQEVTGYPQNIPFPKDFVTLVDQHREAMKLLKIVEELSAPWSRRGLFYSLPFHRRLRKLLGIKGKKL